MNKFLNNFINLLLADTGEGEKLEISWLQNMVEAVRDIINAIVVPVLIIVATVGIVYAIVLGVNYAKAESSDAKEEAKKRIINVVVGAVLMIVLMLVLYLFVNNAHEIFGWVEKTADGYMGDADKTGRLFW